jgi:hypothetical protein
VSPSTLRGRPVVTHHLYDDQGRLVRTTAGSGWTTEDRVLMLAYRQYLSGLCACGEPKATARHPDNDGWFEIDTAATVVCHGCTAIERHRDPAAKPVEYLRLVDTRDYDARPLPDMTAMTRLTA